jgi:Uma2 family endonuclease
MSAAPRYPRDTGLSGLRMTADEFFALGETADHYELIDGVVVMSPSPVPDHGEVLAEVIFQIKTFAQTNRGVRVFPETDLRLGSGLVYRPDLLVYGPGRLVGRPEQLDSPPDLIVELLSPSSKSADLITKRGDYDAFGVGEYWVIDPAGVTAKAWQRSGPRMVEALVDRNFIQSVALPGLRLDLEAIRQTLL